jgi:hypothetical protein
LARFILATALLVICMVHESDASCGDYVGVGDLQFLTGHSAADRPSDLPRIPFAGCRGPDCQRHIPAPTGPSRDPVTMRSDEHAQFAVAFQPPSLAPSWFALYDVRRPIDGHRRPIEHPPRQGG